MHRIKIVGHCVPPRNAITRVMLSLGQGKGDQERGGGGANLFSATCIPVDAPSALLYFLVGCAQVEQVQCSSDATYLVEASSDAH